MTEVDYQLCVNPRRRIALLLPTGAMSSMFARWRRTRPASTTCAYLSPTPGFFAPFYYCQCLCPYGQRCSDTNDGLFERRVVSVYNVYLHILCMIEPGKDIWFSSSVKNLHNMHLSRRLHRSTSDGLLMVAQRKGVFNIHCILARFMHI